MRNSEFFLEAEKIEKLNKIEQYKLNTKGVIQIAGVVDSSISFISAYIADSFNRQGLIIATSENKAKRIYENLQFFTKKKIIYLQGIQQVFFKFDAKSHTVLSERISSLIEIINNDNCIVVTSIEGALKKMVPKNDFLKNVYKISVGNTIEIEELNYKLLNLGYERANQVEVKGQFSIRGGILDVFPIDSENPYRIELFDNEIDSVRSFDAFSQRSIENHSEILLFPAQMVIPDDKQIIKGIEKINDIYDKQIDILSGDIKERLIGTKEKIINQITNHQNMQMLENYIDYFFEETSNLINYMNEDVMIMVEDNDRIIEKITSYERESAEDFKMLLEKGECVPEEYDSVFTKNDYIEIVENRLTFLYSSFIKNQKEVNDCIYSESIKLKQMSLFQGQLGIFLEEVKKYIKNDYKIVIVASTIERKNNVYEYLDRNEIETINNQNEKIILKEKIVTVCQGSINNGFEVEDSKIAIISDADIFINAKKKRKVTKKDDRKPIKLFTDLKPGDYVVHENHGVGKFIGIVQLEVQLLKKDYLKIQYSGEDILYVHTEQMDYVQKFVGADAKIPKVHKLNSPDWKKTKSRVKKEIEDMAEELIEVSAKRSAIRGHAFAKDTVWQKEFEDQFPYEETQDQLRCIEEIKSDMEKELPMDRLLCGDVGYGKTEVAVRAAFKCAEDGKQVAVLVPTTILANQHYSTFVKRFEAYPFNVEMVSRFRSDKEIEEIEKKVEAGKIDVIVGTHRLLSKDIKFKDLGLLIIDEEQKFGVKHKEIIKQIKNNVDVLTLSATPIPRTLNMSLMGLRDMSTIEEPPEERYPVQTYVLENDDEVIREAILREMDRGGQVFLLYNRVRGIRRISALLQKLVPEAKIAVAHGQMDEKDLESIMLSFMENKYDVLVSTTIIESGIDIPNANTMIIYDADRFGLSQLYQLRGRVGRSDRMAYAYFTYQKDKVLTELAEKRLKAIKEFTEFGAGFKISMRDLEIRGAGNLVGSQQHGQMMLIGYE